MISFMKKSKKSVSVSGSNVLSSSDVGSAKGYSPSVSLPDKGDVYYYVRATTLNEPFVVVEQHWNDSCFDVSRLVKGNYFPTHVAASAEASRLTQDYHYYQDVIQQRKSKK